MCAIIQQSIKKPTTNLRSNALQAQRNKKGGKVIHQTITLHKESKEMSLKSTESQSENSNSFMSPKIALSQLDGSKEKH